MGCSLRTLCGTPALPVCLAVCLQNTSVLRRTAAQGQQEGLETGLTQLQLHGSYDASSSSNNAGKPAASTGEESVSQSRASSQIRVRKFHKLLDEQLVGHLQDRSCPQV